MTVITKAALAAELQISKARVSQYVARGMPVRGDGKLDREVAVKWVGDNHRTSTHHRDAGASRAVAIVKATRAPSKPTKLKPATLNPIAVKGAELNPADANLLLATVELVVVSEPIMARVARAIGLPAEVAYAAASILRQELLDAAHDFLDRVGFVGADPDEPFGLISSDFHEADWTILGEPLDLEAWDRFRAALPYYASNEDVPPPAPKLKLSGVG